ncbi:MAG: S9 family peptidase [Acidobacteria bacterium]|nr:S9 family peptidase [Acidobacteriota bacterium]
MASHLFGVRKARVIGASLLFCLAATWFALRPQQAQQAAAAAQAKRALTHQDYDAWRSINGTTLSRDGKYLGYAAMPQDGDGEIIVKNLATGAEWRAPRGWRAPAPPPASAASGGGPPTAPGPGGPFGAAAGRGARPFFTADSRLAIFTIEPNKADVLKARKEKKAPDAMPKNAMGLLDLVTGQLMRVERVKSFQVPEDIAGWLAYQLEAKVEEKKPEPNADAAKPSQDDEGDQQRGRGAVQGGAGRPGGARKEYGTDLVLRKLSDNTERTISDALDYSFSNDAKALLYTVSAKQEEKNGLFAVTPGTDGTTELLSGKGKYTRLTWDEDQTQLAFFSDRDDSAAKQPKSKIYYWKRTDAKASELVSNTIAGFRSDMVISERGGISFAQDGSRLFLGVAPPPEPEKDADAAIADDEKVVADLWHWKDDYIQPMQKVRVEQERNRSYRAVYHLAEKKFVQLADPTMESVNPSRNGLWAIGTDDRAYRRLIGYDSGGKSDTYLVNTLDGSRKQLLKGTQGAVSLSPNAKFGLFYDGKDWNTISLSDGKITNLTSKLGVSFWQEDNDMPDTPRSYGNAGWVKDDKYVLLYDQFDIWQIAPDGSSAKNLTDGVGRKDKIEFRYVRLDPEERFIDPAKPLLLRADVEWTHDSGFYRDRIDGAAPEKLLMGAKSFAPPTKAKNADVLMLTASRFDEYPDVHITDSSFKALKKVTNEGAQKDKFTWGKAELVRFKNTDGVALTASLIKPDNFDPNKKYPLMVYIYEKLSEGVNRFVNPAPGGSINAAYYASNGYLVLQPDIVYTIGYPGQSALKCVLPAIQAVVDKGYVNEDAIGIQGHSWGGYQIAYMVTQTNRFKAAAPGALVANMTSAYSGIRWGTGLPRQFQYEHTQSRIGGSLWEQQMRYLENSPIFRVDRVQTPILMLHNDNDDAVPWYQGIEYYLGLRRLGKEVYMFNYNGEPHGIRKRQNQKDYTRRLQEFFDHKLKGAPMPDWMNKGIRYIEREKEKETYKTASDVANSGKP